MESTSKIGCSLALSIAIVIGATSLETLGFLLSCFLASLFILMKIRQDVFPRQLKDALNRFIISNWKKSLNSLVPNFESSELAKSTDPIKLGILPSDTEWVTESPLALKPSQEETYLFYGIDSKQNYLVLKFYKSWTGGCKYDLALKIGNDIYTDSKEAKSDHSSEVKEFSLGNFRLELVVPFRCWRIWFNGKMKKANETTMHHVVLNFLWKPLDNPRDMKKDSNEFLLSGNISDVPIGADLVEHLSLPNGYKQFGCLHGTTRVDKSLKELYLYGFRERMFPSNFHGSMQIFVMDNEDGDAISLESNKANGQFSDAWINGEIYYSDISVNPIKRVCSEASKFKYMTTFPRTLVVEDKKSTFHLDIWPQFQTTKLSCLEVITFKLTINWKSACGILCRQHSVPQFSERYYAMQLPRTVQPAMDIINFRDILGTDIGLVGGKALSLSKLSRIVPKNSAFETAKGFCVTTSLFRKYVKIQELQELFSSQLSLERQCILTQELIISSNVETKLEPLVKEAMVNTFGENYSRLRFAVRSSGVLEDGADLSCAGQNETFLGVSESDVCKRIVQCWCSLFTEQSIKYRLNHGQSIASEMGVVVQEIVNPKSSGVLFTASPTDGNPFQMYITSNYGLGESVVSGSSDPDTFVIALSRSTEVSSDFQIESKVCGEKATKVVLSDEGESETVPTTPNEQNSFCVEEKELLNLCSAAMEINEAISHTKPVDIEWAITAEGTLFILQCRPMTSLDLWTEFELSHEMDAPLRTPHEFLSTANTGEVLPKPFHPISINGVNGIMNLGIQLVSKKYTGGDLKKLFPLFVLSSPIYMWRLFLNLYNTLYMTTEETITPATSATDLSVFGRPVITNEIHQVALRRNGKITRLRKLKSIIGLILSVRNASKVVDKDAPFFLTWTPKCLRNVEKLTAKDVYQSITHEFSDLLTITKYHILASHASSGTMTAIFIILVEGKNAEDWSASIYEDAGELLAVCANVESAELPDDMEELGDSIYKHNIDAFLSSKTTSEAIQCLRNVAETKGKLDKFMDKHGHRCIAELDIGEDPWRDEPTPLVGLLKNIVENKRKSLSNNGSQKRVNPKNDESLLASLKTPLKTGTKRTLKFILPHNRRMVACRETTKSLLVRVMYQFKKSYRLLGEMLVTEKLLPDASLVKFLTHVEIGTLIYKETHRSTLLYKAMKRQRLYSTLAANEFPEMSFGLPQPNEANADFEVGSTVRGSPVSGGKVRGIAKVCLTVQEASENLSKGDILITKGTDIAWSPFFPILGGVVTELGGLISHGAVVAREYGIPCIVGAVNATRIFRSGDEVLLDTTTGTISKIEQN